MIEWLADNWLAFLFWAVVSWIVLIIAALNVADKKEFHFGWIATVLLSSLSVFVLKLMFIASLVCNALVYLKG